MENNTIIKEFRIIGFSDLQMVRIPLFLILLLVYTLTCIGNLFIITLVPIINFLHTAMYFFLSNLSLSDILLTSNIVPNMLHFLVADDVTMTVNQCIIQYYIFGSLAATECLLLSVMSYDRYLAICHPLRYSSVMDGKLCLHLIILSWLIGFTPTLPVAVCVSKLWFCDLNTINHFFCDLGPFLELACSDTSTVKLLAFVFSFLVTFFPFLLIIISYCSIIHTIVQIKSENGRRKAFSTCSSHLAVVSTYYGSLIVLYVVPSNKHSLNINKFLPLLYTVVTPLINPIIYSLKNKDIKKAAKKSFRWGLERVWDM